MLSACVGSASSASAQIQNPVPLLDSIHIEHFVSSLNLNEKGHSILLLPLPSSFSSYMNENLM